VSTRSRTDRRAEQRARRKRDARAKQPPAVSPAAAGEAPPEPAFFYGFATTHAKIAFARFWIFGLLAFDALRQIPHAPRYRAGDFNVGHIPGLDGLAPGREAFVAIQIAFAFVFGAIAAGVGSRITVAIAAVGYAWVYLSSQLDAYQHHYLVGLVLGLAVFVPWFGDRDGPRDAPVRTWAVRVILIQLGIVYLWAAIAKLDPRWLDGTALEAQLGESAGRTIIEAVSFRIAAIAIVVVEMFLAFAIWIPRLWPFALLAGVALHAGIATTNLEIGLFSWLMIAFYVLIIPERWFVFFASWIPRGLPTKPWKPALALAVVAVLLPLLRVDIDGVAIGAVLGVAIVIADQLLDRRRRFALSGPLAVAVTGAAIAVVTPIDRIPNDYYKFWGGSTRRLVGDARAIPIYERMIDVVPDDPQGHYMLGKLLLPTDPERGLRELRTAQKLEPKKPRAFLEEAHHLSSIGDKVRALERAKAALAADPTSDEAAALVVELERSQP
jgi:hypothetical protein